MRLFLLLIGFLLAAPSARAQDIEKFFTFRVAIDAAGKVAQAVPDDTTAAFGADIVRVAAGLSRGLEFTPATRDGVPVPSETGLTLRVRFQAIGVGYQPVLLSAVSGPQVQQPGYINFPPGMKPGAAAAVRLMVPIGADGRVVGSGVTAVEAVPAPGAGKMIDTFVKAGIDSVRRWRYTPDRVGGQPVATQYEQGLNFCARGDAYCDTARLTPRGALSDVYPRAASPGVTLPRLRVAPAAPVPAGPTTRALFRVAIDADGRVSALHATGRPVTADAASVAATALRGARFMPARVDGRAVSSELNVVVPVHARSDGRGPDADLRALAWDIDLLQAPEPDAMLLNMSAGRTAGTALVRLRVALDAQGRGDRAASKIELLQIDPPSPTVRRRFSESLMQSVARMRVEPVLVDGHGVPMQFVRGWAFCVGSGVGCVAPALDAATVAAERQGAILPAGVELPRLAAMP